MPANLSGPLLIAILSLAVANCGHVENLPINQPTADSNAGFALSTGIGGRAASDSVDDYFIGLSFSGGGTRAAAFSFGVLQEMDRAKVSARGRKVEFLDRVNFVSGVSGGSVSAAYFGLKKRAGYGDFRERFLIKDAEEALTTEFSLVNINRAFSGGVNEDTRLRNWLDANVFEGATFSSLLASRPTVWINATDVYNRTPFVFIPVQFSAICSDLSAYPISAAVAASAAVPVAFAPIVLETYPDRCKPALPDWLVKAQTNLNASPLLYAFARGLKRQSDGSMKYVKLFDGGLVDNYGLSGFTIARAGALTPYGPLTPHEAVNLRRAMFLTVDAGSESRKDWVQNVRGPSGAQLMGAIADVSVDAASRASYGAFEATMRNWQQELIRWRCGLSKSKVEELRGSGPWNCRDLKIYVSRVSFENLDKDVSEKLNQVPTRFKLPVETVDEVISAGGKALSNNPTYREFLGGL